jgi:teichoic acid transport system permease protein
VTTAAEREEATAALSSIGARLTLRAYLKEIWRRREFVVSIPLGTLRAQNMNTVLGNFWHLLNPLFLVGVYYLVFGLLLDISRGTDNFVAFLSIGVFIFHFTRKCVQAGAKSIVSNLQLLRVIRFPRAIMPLANVIGEVVAMAPVLLVLFVLLLATGERPHLTWTLMVPILALQSIFNLGCALLMARLTHHFRDVEHFLPYVITIWLYLSGVFYEVTAFMEPGVELTLFELNPVYRFIRLARQALQEGVTASEDWLVAGAWSIGALVLGFWFFRRREADYGRG